MIPYTHKTHPRARSLKIKVEASGEVVVVTPQRYSASDLERFITQNLYWIQQAQQKAIAKHSFSINHHQVAIFGKTYLLQLQYSTTERVGITISGEQLKINPLEPSATLGTPKIKSQLERFLKATAEKYIGPRTHQLAEHMGISFTSISLRQQKTRWGSCSSSGSLNFNWRLVHYPPAVIDYVIIHELAHRKQMNHSAAFWQIVRLYDPEYLLHRGWLKRHGMSEG